MLLNRSSEKGYHQLTYDNIDEAISKAEELHERNLNVCVISTEDKFIVFAPPPSLLNSNEKYIYYNGKKYQS